MASLRPSASALPRLGILVFLLIALGCAYGAQSAAASEGPVAAYSFDEGAGTTAEDISGNGHTATLEDAEWVRGRYGDALGFDGESACATIADATDLRFSEEFTVEAWVRPEGPRSDEPVLVKEGGGFPDYSLGIGSLLAEASIGKSAGGSESVSASPLEADVWRHLAATFDGANLRLFVDGELVGARGHFARQLRPRRADDRLRQTARHALRREGRRGTDL